MKTIITSGGKVPSVNEWYNANLQEDEAKTQKIYPQESNQDWQNTFTVKVNQGSSPFTFSEPLQAIHSLLACPQQINSRV